jgi:hypothetical protein
MVGYTSFDRMADISQHHSSPTINRRGGKVSAEAQRALIVAAGNNVLEAKSIGIP